jgi:ABC-type glycerol-3-phosphate transport system substrate-binding protein
LRRTTAFAQDRGACAQGEAAMRARPSVRRSRGLRRIGMVAVASVLWAVWTGCSERRPIERAASGADTDDAAFLDTLAVRTFRFFWEQSDPQNGMTPDRWPTRSFVSVSATGFALTAYPIGVERGWVSRAAARERVLNTLRFFWQAPQNTSRTRATGHAGFLYHFLDSATGLRFDTVELSTIDTALFLGGALFCQSYFDGADADEAEVRALAESLYARVDWRWAQPRPPLVSHGWTPEDGYLQWDWDGYNEAMLLYVLALGAPRHAVAPAAWPAWTSTYRWGEFEGQHHLGFPPLFGHQYSHVWIDFSGIQDAPMREHASDYFENSRRATLAQQAYAVRNPGGFVGYGAHLWGLTACDGPLEATLEIDGKTRQFRTYSARGASFMHIEDDGTIAPTAAGGSIAFAPEIVVPTLRAMHAAYGDLVFSRYGFVDAFNPTLRQPIAVQHGRIDPEHGWFDTDYLGIDQGPILAMLENHRSGLVWRTMRRNPHVVRGLRAAGFTGGWLDSLAVREGPRREAPAPRREEPVPVGRGAAATPPATPPAPPSALAARHDTRRETLRFWAMGREGEVVQELVRDFEAENPDVRVRVQQIPWTAAHEKLLTAHVGRSTPDLAQLGNTWIAEFVALRALEPLDPYLAASATLDSTSYFPGIWDTNRIDAHVYGVPWYVDTRVLFYRKDLLRRAGYDAVPATWDEWKRAMHAVKRAAGPGRYAIFLALNEWPPPVILGLQAGSPLLTDDATRAAFAAPPFRRAFDFFLSMFREGLAPPIANHEIANLYQEFARGYFSMYISGPWNVGEFKRRLPPELQDDWGTAPLPGPLGPGVSLAGGSSLVLFQRSRHKDAAWKLVEFLSRPEQQDRFRELTGNLPARVEAWGDPTLAQDPYFGAFHDQLQRVVSTPKLPEWELIATRLQERVERAVRGGAPPDSLLRAFDRDVDRILEKRRWMRSRQQPVEVAR